MKKEILLSFIIVLSALSSCSNDEDYTPVEPAQVSPVVLNLNEAPYQLLSEYNFFNGDLKNLEPVYGVLPYKPISSLFSDYALKKRFVWMPGTNKASYVSDYEALNFPTGTVLIKNFYYNNVQPSNTTRIVETRLMIKHSDTWIFAEYIWNDEQTEAFLDEQQQGGFTDIEWIENGETKTVNYRIPAQAECFTCHNQNSNPIPIGLKPQSLNANYPFSDGTKNQLQKLIEFGYLENTLPTNIETVVDWKDTSQPVSKRIRSYFDINCAHCHSDERYCNYRPVRFAFNENASEENLGVCVDPDTQIPPYTKIVDPSNSARSVLYFRMNTTAQEFRMPLLGRTLIHEEALPLVEEWINTLTTDCQ